jgi:protocatechuate 3,4-dioxygenase beta subunit
MTEISRRKVLVVGGTGAVALGVGAVGLGRSDAETDATSVEVETVADTGSTTVCALSAEVTQGPYWLDDSLIRKDITEGKGGVPLRLDIKIVDVADGCTPLKNVAVEVWHCDAWGYYSGYTTMPPGGEVPAEDGVGDENTYLRGVQITDGNGHVRIQTIVPGWYSPRVTHIHVKVWTGGHKEKHDGGGRTYEDGTACFVGQILFPDTFCEKIAEVEPYSKHKQSLTKLTADQVYSEALAEGGDAAAMVPAISYLHKKHPWKGVRAEINFGVDPSHVSGGGGGGGTPPTGPPPTDAPTATPTATASAS